MLLAVMLCLAHKIYDRLREPAWMLGFQAKRTDLREKYYKGFPQNASDFCGFFAASHKCSTLTVLVGRVATAKWT